MLKAILTALAASCSVLAQSAMMILPDGRDRPVAVVQAGGESLAVMERNPGLPDPWGNGWTPGDPVYFDALRVQLPDDRLVPMFYGAAKTGPGSWLAARADQFKYRSFRNGVPSHPKFAGTVDHHAVMPADTLYLRFVPADDPYEKRWLAKVPLDRIAQFEAMFVAPDVERLSAWGWMSKVRDLYRYDHTSMNRAAPVGARNVGWGFVPENYMKRFTGHPVGVRGITNWYGGLGHRVPHAALSNEKYRNDFIWIREGVWRRDHVALSVGLNFLRAKIAYGLIDCDQANQFRGFWRNENGDFVRGSTGIAPSGAKSWDRGLVAAWILLRDADPIIARGKAVRIHRLKTGPFPWPSGMNGARNLGNELWNLLDWYRATGDPELKTVAESWITKTFASSANGMTRLYFRESNAAEASGGEGLTALTSCCEWVFAEGVRPDLKPHLEAMQDFYAANLGRWITADQFRASYFRKVDTVPPTDRQDSWSGTFQGCWWPRANMAGITPAMTAVSHGIDAFIARRLASAGSFDAFTCPGGPDPAFTDEGPAWAEKWLAIVASN